MMEVLELSSHHVMKALEQSARAKDMAVAGAVLAQTAKTLEQLARATRQISESA